MKFVDWTQRHFGKTISKYGYRFISLRVGDEEVYFLNFGYEEDPPMDLKLKPEDEPDRYSIQLYHRTATQVDLTGKKVLEVSCGHGGAASYIMRYLHPAQYTGLDYNPAGIEYCKRKHKLPGLDFVHGDAEDLPFPDGSFDAVINVEAAHLYPNYPRFLDEVARVLKPGGHFLYADLRDRKDLAEWETDMDNSSLRRVAERNIDADVLRGLEKKSPRVNAQIEIITPRPFRWIGKQIGGSEGGGLHKEVKDGRLDYRIFLFVKD